MKWIAALFLFAFPLDAVALTRPQSGFYIDAAGGLALHVNPFGAGPGWQGGGGLWWGPYDDAYAVGRFTSIGAALRQDLVGGRLVTMPGLELRRGWDLLVVKPWLFAVAGPELGDALGVQARVGGAAKFRFHRFLGATGRVEAGAAWVDGTVSGRVGAALGFEWSTPFRPPAR